jgi:hypothetical protein
MTSTPYLYAHTNNHVNSSRGKLNNVRFLTLDLSHSGRKIA